MDIFSVRQEADHLAEVAEEEIFIKSKRLGKKEESYTKVTTVPWLLALTFHPLFVVLVN